MERRIVLRWVIVIFLSVVGAALMAGPDFGEFFIYLAGILLLAFVIRELEKAQKRKGEKQDSE